MLSFLTARASWLPQVLFYIYLLLFAVLAINPVSRKTWFDENLTVILIILPIAILFLTGVRLSNLSYLLMSVLIYMHTVGGHYTFALVPFHWFDTLIGSSRDNYDRVAHFTVGFYAFAIAEFTLLRGYVSGKWSAAVFGLFAIGTVAATYEVIEWIYAVASDPSSGAAFLGSQGDQWDAQKDMLCDISGAVFSAVLFLFLGNKYAKK